MRKIILAILIISLMTVPALAADYSMTTLHGISNVQYDGDQTPYVYAIEDKAFTKIDRNGLETSEGVTNVNAAVADVYATRSYYYYVVNTGEVYRTDRDYGLINFATSYTGQPTAKTIKLADVDALDTANRRILVDTSGDVFVTGDRYLYKIKGDTKTSSTYFTAPDPNKITGITPYPTSDMGIALTWGTANNGIKYHVPTTSTLYETVTVTALPTDDYGTIHLLSDNNMLSLNKYTTYDMALLQYQISDPTNITLIGSYAQVGSGFGWSVSEYHDVAVAKDGTIFVSDTFSDILRTFVTADEIGGYDSGATESEYAYSEATVSSAYATYVNNTPILVNYNIVTETITQTEVNTWKQVYDIKIELYDNNDVMIGYNIIDGNNFNVYEFDIPTSSYDLAGYLANLITEYFTNAAITDTFLYRSGSFKFSSQNEWTNGTYYLKMYEINTITGARSLLDTDILEVLDYGYEGNIATEPDDTNEPKGDEVTTVTLLHSSTFKAVGIVLICSGIMFLFGGFSGGIVGAVLGTITAYAFGFVGFAWLILLIFGEIIAIAALFRDVITGK